MLFKLDTKLLHKILINFTFKNYFIINILLNKIYLEF